MTLDAKLEKRLLEVRERIIAAVQAELARGDISAMELLGLLAHTTGACIAMQDQRKVSPALAMEMVAKNIKAGNKEAMADLLTAKGAKQ